MAQHTEKREFTGVGEVCSFLGPLRDAGKTIVTTNGCFDVLHRGHVEYLREAAACGDVLIVGLNSDDTVTRLKGRGRPVQSEIDRRSVVGALEMVDGVFIFREDDPRAFLEKIRPDVHVKGGDYGGDIIEREVVERYGGRVHFARFVTGRSTSSILDRIRGE